jgi:hypothetical protein
MNRREFVRTVGAAALATLGLPVVTHGRSGGRAARGPARKKTAGLAHFEGMKIGVSFHFGMNTFTGDDYGLLADEQVKEMHRLAALLGGAI